MAGRGRWTRDTTELRNEFPRKNLHREPVLQCEILPKKNILRKPLKQTHRAGREKEKERSERTVGCELVLFVGRLLFPRVRIRETIERDDTRETPHSQPKHYV